MPNFTIRIDKKLKEESQKQAKKLGIPLSFVIKTALKTFIKKPQIILKERKIEPITPEFKAAVDDLILASRYGFTED